MASTADIQVSANRGRTTQELHRDALSEKEEKKTHIPVEGVAEGRQEGREQTRQRGKVAQLHKHTDGNHNYSGNRFDADSHCSLD